MAGFFQDLLSDTAGGFFGSNYLRDYNHASKIFQTNHYANTPKFKYSFHVFFDINDAAYPGAKGNNYGLVVKSAKLPSFQAETHIMNQYNRKRIIQSKLKYDPIDITFHDDNGNMVRDMWKAYYEYYYNDGKRPSVMIGSRFINNSDPSLPTNDFNSRTLYAPTMSGDENWGYTGEARADASSNIKIPFFKTINIFSMSRHSYSAYILVNPIITRFAHGEQGYGDGNGTVESSMTLDYETVVYESGAIDGRSPETIVSGFGNPENYDRTLSPLARPGSQGNILGQGGLVDGVNGTIDSLAAGDLFGAIKNAGTTYNTYKNVNLKQVAKSELLSGIQNSLQQTPNRDNWFKLPSLGSSPGFFGSAKQGSSDPSPQKTVTEPRQGI
jgi:hypothetical protein